MAGLISITGAVLNILFFAKRMGLHYNLNPNTSPITENTKKEKEVANQTPDGLTANNLVFQCLLRVFSKLHDSKPKATTPPTDDTTPPELRTAGRNQKHSNIHLQTSQEASSFVEDAATASVQSHHRDASRSMKDHLPPTCEGKERKKDPPPLTK
jgi:hypothetical protein